jgi:tRNA(Arg) A34 adenosine deaminase TadA
MQLPDIVMSMPSWLTSVVRPTQRFETLEARMELAISLASENVRRGTGGPFGAAVFEVETGRLIAPGVNRVVPLNCSIAHAEMMAIALAQSLCSTYDLGGPSMPACELVTSVEPCAMCFGALPWSGVRRLVCGATARDARAIGFDEGPRPADWTKRLEQRGIAVELEVLREGARHVLERYATEGGEIYNGRRAVTGVAMAASLPSGTRVQSHHRRG